MPPPPFGLDWVSKIKILGVYFSNGLIDVDVDNWRSKLDKLTSVLDRWKQRDLSFISRAMILNNLGLSRLWHVSKSAFRPYLGVGQPQKDYLAFYLKGEDGMRKSSAMLRPPCFGGGAQHR